MQDLKMKDQISRPENAGRVITVNTLLLLTLGTHNTWSWAVTDHVISE